MTDRTDRIKLDPKESRCSAAPGTCTMRSKCARAQASIPQGTPLEDFTAGSFGGGTAACIGLILLADLHADAPKPRATKPAIKGLT